MPKRQKAKYKQTEILAPGFDLPDDYEDLKSVYKTLAKSADTRMRRLEQASQEEYYRGAEEYSYRVAMRNIDQWTPGGSRWDTAAPANKSSLIRKIEDIKTFLRSETSTKRGLTNIAKRRVKTINEKYGTNFTWTEWANFANSSLNKKMDSEMGSSTKMMVLGKILRNKDQIVKAVQEANEKNIVVSNSMTDLVMKKTIEKHGPEVAEILLDAKKTDRKKSRKK